MPTASKSIYFQMATALSGGHTGSVLCVDVTKDGSQLATGGEGGELCIWSVDGGLSQKYVRPDTDCTSVTFSEKHTLYVSFDDKVEVFDTRNISNPVATLAGNQEEINQIILDEKEKFLAACDDSGEIKIFDLQERRVYKTLRHKHTNICATACFRPGKPWEIFTGGLDSKLIHWDFSRPKCLNQYNMQELHNPNSDLDSYMVNPPFVHHLIASPDGHYLVGALENGILAVFDISRKNLRELYSLHAHSQGVSQVHFLSNSKILSGGNDCCLVLWDLEKSSDQASENNAASGDSASNNGHGSLMTNGSTRPQEVRNENMSHACKVLEIEHSGKINWMKPFLKNDTQYVAIADQSTDITVRPIQQSVN